MSAEMGGTIMNAITAGMSLQADSIIIIIIIRAIEIYNIVQALNYTKHLMRWFNVTCIVTVKRSDC